MTETRISTQVTYDVFWPQITIDFSIKRECIEVFPIIRNVLTDLPPEMSAFVCLRWFEDEV